ncbi:MAG TPA: glutamate--cysteine ligase [Gammaproteobacteria bacterium]
MQALNTVPHLVTANPGPLQIVEAQLLLKQTEIETWLRRQWQATPAPFYTSVDLRNAGFKLAPVDTNLFPAGFNNLNPRLLPLAYHAVQAAMQQRFPRACNILIIPENHTRNLYYLENLYALKQILTQAGYSTRIGSLSAEITAPKTITLPSGKPLTLEPILRKHDRITLTDFSPCLILLNNDLSGGRPAILENLQQPILPPFEAGWDTRRKSGHFSIYGQVAQEFSAMLGIDPWLIDPLMRNCGCIDFMKKEGYECLEQHVTDLLADIRRKYAEYGIEKKPFVFVKADSGTYGLGVMTVSSGEEIRNLNRKQRTRMDATKEGRKVESVLIQEGIYTSENFNGAVAEPVVYMIDHFVIGGFYRVHKNKTQSENLNSPGMHFEPLAFAEPCNSPDCEQQPDSEPNRFYAYGVIARLAALAAARELPGAGNPAANGQT